MGMKKWVRAAMIGLLLGTLSGCPKKVPPPPPPTDNAPKPVELKVFSVRPNQGKVGLATAVALSGTGFKADAKVSVGSVAVTEMSVNGTESIRATVPAGLKAGVYDVVVMVDGKEARLQGGFTVVEPPPKEDTPKNSDCSLTTIYFDFDMSNLSDDARSALQRNVECLKAKNAKRIQVEGHTDERGSTEYNLALGQRRADEVKDYLTSLGLGTVSAISYGEEQGAVQGSDEDAWSKNRRAEIKIQD
jgi:peptidoglycan-associated lipoprotein